MSQLNNDANKFNLNEFNANSTKPKMKTVTKVIIFLIVFTVIAVGTTAGAIIYTNSNTTKNKPEVPAENAEAQVSEPIEVVSDGLGIKSLTEQYNENDLKISTLTDVKGTRTPSSQWDTNTNKLTVDYIQIDGLKNTAIEDEINSKIKDATYSLYSEEEFNNSEIDRIYISSYCTANFGNVLSMDISKSVIYKNKDIDSTYTTSGLNIDLTTGSELSFTDLFTNSSIKNALIQGVYTYLVDQYGYDAMTDIEMYSIDMSNVDLSAIEEETYIMVNNIIKNMDNFNFCFSPSYIFIYMDGEYYIGIDMETIYENIAIYNRFKTENTIFDGTYSGQKNIFVLCSRDFGRIDLPYTYYEDVYDNLRIEAVVDNSIYTGKDLISETDIKPLVASCVSQIESKISDVKNMAKNNPDKAYIYTAYYNVVSSYDYELNNLNIDNLLVSASGTNIIYTMSKDYYTNTYYAKIGEFYRKDEPYVRFVFEDYLGEDEDVSKQEFIDEIASFDYYTKKTKEELLQEHNSNQIQNSITSEEYESTVTP